MERKVIRPAKDLEHSFVVGFAFIGFKPLVVLIQKRKPEWQAGQLNGTGGHMKEGETPKEAMAREFEEETGIKTRPDRWLESEDFHYNNGVVLHVLTTQLFGDTTPVSLTDEIVSVFPIRQVIHMIAHPDMNIQGKIIHALKRLGFDLSPEESLALFRKHFQNEDNTWTTQP